MRLAAPALALLASAACIEEAPLDRRPCPCVAGWACCPLIDACIEETRMCWVGAEGERLAPYPVGARWVYRVKTGSREEIKTQTVAPPGPVPAPPEEPWDRTGYRIVGEVRRGAELVERTEAWQEQAGLRSVRHHERRFNAQGDELEAEWWRPGRLRVDEDPSRLEAHAKWVEAYAVLVRARGTERAWRMNTDGWTSLGAQRCEVPAGVFSCLGFKRGDKTFWFARGIGKVKERDDRGTTEELMQFTRD